VSGPGGETVVVSVSRLPGASTPDVVQGVLRASQALAPSLPAGVHLEPVYDQAALVSESMASVRDAILIGIALCVGVVGLFLRSLRAGLIAALVVPVTLAMSLLAAGGRRAEPESDVVGRPGSRDWPGDRRRHRRGRVDRTAAWKRARRWRTMRYTARGPCAPLSLAHTTTTVVVLVPLVGLRGVVGQFFSALAVTLGRRCSCRSRCL